MKKASMVAIFITTFFYLCCGCFGYAAFGDATPGNLLTGFGFFEPYWLIDIANVCIIIHLVGGYQVLFLPIKIHIITLKPYLLIYHNLRSFCIPSCQIDETIVLIRKSTIICNMQSL